MSDLDTHDGAKWCGECQLFTQRGHDHEPEGVWFTPDSLAAALRALDDAWGATVPSFADAHSSDEFAAAIIQAAKEAERE